MQELERVQRLGDDALIERLTHSVRGDRQLTVRMLVELGEVQERGLFRDLGFSTMFDYATCKLGMSEGEAVLRLRVARLGREIPVALEMLARCEVNMSALAMLIPVLKPDKLEPLYEARCKSKRQVHEIIARHAPKPDKPDSVRQLPAARPNTRASRNEPAAVLPLAPSPAAPVAAASAPAPAEFRHHIKFTASQRVRDLLVEAQDLLRHRCPNGDLETIFEQALELLVAREKKKKFGLTDKPRAKAVGRPAEHSRYIPPDMRREVYARDGGQCRFIGRDGQRCSARDWLEFHHDAKPYGQGGVTSVENLCLMCRLCRTRHNRHYAAFGFMPHTLRGTRGLPRSEGVAWVGPAAYAA